MFFTQLNGQVLSLCKSMPSPLQNTTLLFLMNYSKIQIGEELSFFRNYYAPAWSIIYWIVYSGSENKPLSQIDIKEALTAHSMAMFLHSLDDHLTDGEVPLTHLNLLLRSQAWLLMKASLDRLCERIPAGNRIVRTHIDDYYDSIAGSQKADDFESYCTLFRKQMATWLIVPSLLTKRLSARDQYTEDIESAYGSFGIAWRLLDDINDMAEDMTNGTHSAVYWCLPATIQHYWNRRRGEGLTSSDSNHDIVLEYLFESAIIQQIVQIICNELESAVQIAIKYNLTGLMREFRTLLKPLRDVVVT